MENKELLEQIQASLEKQNHFAKLQCILTAIVVVCCVGVIWTVNSVLPQLQDLSVQAETTLTNLQGITEQLAQTDLQGMVHNVDQLVSSSQSAVEQTMTKMNSLDLDTLNKAIKDLAAVIEPMAKFFGMFS